MSRLVAFCIRMGSIRMCSQTTHEQNGSHEFIQLFDTRRHLFALLHRVQCLGRGLARP